MSFDLVKTRARKWGRIFLLHMQDGLQYRLRSLVWMFVGLFSTTTLVLFWKANLSSNPGAYTENFTELLSYFVLMLLLGNIVVSHTEEDIAKNHIYRGELSKYLLKPASYLAINFSSEFPWRLMSGGWGMIALVFASFFGLRLTITQDPRFIALAVLSAILGHILSHLICVCLGLAAIWLTTTKGLFELYEMVLLFGAGFMVPLSHLSGIWRLVGMYSPFASILYVPVRLLQGQYEIGTALFAMLIQVLWLGVFFLLYRVIWKRGVLAFTGVGQ